MFALAKIATTFNHIYTAGTLMTFCTGVFFPLFTPIERPIAYCTVTCIDSGHGFILSMIENFRF
jgi:hypothetical protein